jgi:hypothetical protein
MLVGWFTAKNRVTSAGVPVGVELGSPVEGVDVLGDGVGNQLQAESNKANALIARSARVAEEEVRILHTVAVSCRDDQSRKSLTVSRCFYTMT